MTTTYVKHPVTGGAAEVARLVLTDKNGTPKEVSALWKDGVCLFAKKGALAKNGNEMEDIDGNDVMAWSLPSDTPVPRHTYPWESEIIPLHDEDRWYVIVPNSVVVTMGGVDITDTCYDAETHKISIPMVKGDIVVEAEATEVIQFETEMQTLPSVTFLGQREETADEDFVDDGLAHFSTISGNTFVWNQLLEHTGSQVETISTAVYYKRINGVESVFTSEGETITAETDTDMLINLTHLYGANARNFPLAPTNANTLAQFKTFFPLEYYPYSAPRLMNLAITSITASSNGLSTVFDLDVKNITGKLNGSGDSVKVFPDGMDNAGLPDYIYNDEGVWKAVARNKGLVFELAGKTYVQDGAYRIVIGTGRTNAPCYGTNSDAEVVCDHYMTSTFGRMYGRVDGEGYCAIRRKPNETTCYFYVSPEDYSKGVENLPTVNIVYPLIDAKIYVLDDTWQTILDQTFHYTKGSILTTETNTSEPATAPLTIAVASNIRGWKLKPICVANWGGHYIDNEITAKEAASVTDLGGAFYANTNIVKFNELRYFIGLTSLYYQGSSTSTMGQFANCSKLTEISVPDAKFTQLRGAIRGTAIKELDLSRITATNLINMSYLNARSTSGSAALTKIIFPAFRISNILRTFQRNGNLKEIEIIGYLNFKNTDASGYTQAFYECVSLEKITVTKVVNKETGIFEGGITGIKYSIDFKDTILNVQSALIVLNGLESNVSNQSISFNAAMQETYEADSDFNTAVETAVANGWEIVYA